MAFPIFFRTMTAFRGSSPRMTPTPSSSNTVETTKITPAIAPVTPTARPASSAAVSLVSSKSSASALASASPLRSMVEHAAENAVIFISTFLFGNDVWGNAAAPATSASTKPVQPANAARPRDGATTVRLSHHHHHHRSHPRRPRTRGVKTFAPSLPSIGEDSAIIDVDEAELQRERAARLTRFELRMLARSSFDDDDEEDDDSDDSDDSDDQPDQNEEEEELQEVGGATVDDEEEIEQDTVSDNLEVEEFEAPVEVVELAYEEDEGGEPEQQPEEAQEEKQEKHDEEEEEKQEKEEKEENDEEENDNIEDDNNDSVTQQPLHDDESESESESVSEGKRESDAAETVTCDDSDDAAACAGEEESVAGHHVSFDLPVTSEADVLVEEDQVGGDLDHIDELDQFEEEAGEDEINMRMCNAAATKIQRLVRHWVNANIQRLVHDAHEMEAETDNDDEEDEDMKDDAASVTSTSSTSTSTSTTTSSSDSTSPSSTRSRIPTYSHAKPMVDSNNSDKRTRQYAVSPATLLRRAAQAQRRAEIKRGTEALEARVRNAKAKVDSHRPRPRTKTASEQQ